MLNNLNEKSMEHMNVKGQKQNAQATFPASFCDIKPYLPREGGKR